MTREELIEVMAAVILDAHHLWLEDDTDFSGFETRFASAALAGLEAAGVRLVYVGEAPAQLIDGDERTTVRIFTPYATDGG